MNSLIKVSLLFICFCGCLSETFVGNAALDIPTQIALSNQYSNLILEFQSVTSLSNAVGLWRAYLQNRKAEFDGTSYLEEEVNTDDDFVLEEDKVKEVKHKKLEMWGPMGGYGYGGPSPNFGSDVSSRQIESQMEYSFMNYLKFLGLITARKLDNSQNIHYQSRAITSVLSTVGTSNPMASTLLYLLYFRDVLQTLQSSQSIQRHDIWTFWNYLEILETNEDPDKTHVNRIELKSIIRRAYATSMQVFATEAMYDFQIFMIDYYLSPMLGQIVGANTQQTQAAAPQPASAFIQEELEAEPNKPFVPMMNSPQYMSYYILMIKFYTKYILLTATQSLSTAAHQKAAGESPHISFEQLDHMRLSGVEGLNQWCQMKYFLLYFDMYFMMAAPGAPLTGFDGPAHVAASNLVQTESQVEPRAENPVAEAQPAVAEPAAVIPQIPVPQAAPARQSVVG